jgi:hypothetical protein
MMSRIDNPSGNSMSNAALAVCVILCGGCAAGFNPQPVETVPFRDRAETQVERGIQVTTAVPSAKESRDLFGISLYRKRVQPVWLEIQNDTDEFISFLPVGLDADYHSPFEVASLTPKQKEEGAAERHFFQSRLNVQIAPGDTRSGFIFTTLDEGTKGFNVDIIGSDSVWQFTFFIPVPGLAIDHYDVDWQSLYADDEITDFTEPDPFIEALRQLPCCTVDAKGESQGDPLNIVIIGRPRDVYYAVIRAQWDETEAVTTASGFKTVMSFITGGEYRYSPVSNLYVFGRDQDIALQKIRENIHERNHFRLWLAPMTFEGVPVWIGQISRDIGVRFTKKTITTHKIDPDVDETREFLLENLAYSQVLAKFAYVDGVGAAPIDEPRANLTGDPYFTDGLRVVMWISREYMDLADIRYETWSDPEG